MCLCLLQFLGKVDEWLVQCSAGQSTAAVSNFACRSTIKQEYLVKPQLIIQNYIIGTILSNHSHPRHLLTSSIHESFTHDPSTPSYQVVRLSE
jgi:hypothetical protein